MTNIAVIGAGYWGKNLIRNFAELGVLYSVCDNNIGQATKFAELYNVKQHTWQEVLDDSNISAVAIAVPAAQHVKFCQEALLANKHVFVEKPIALDINDAEMLCDLAKQQNKILMVGHLLQYHAAFIDLNNKVKNGELGRVHHIYSNRLSLGKVRTEENVLWSFAPHDISMVLELVEQQPHKVEAVASDYLTSSIADTVTTHLSFANGVHAQITVSWMHPFKEQKLTVIGEKAMAVFDDTKPLSEKLAIYKHDLDRTSDVPCFTKAEPEYIKLEPAEPLKEELKVFINSVETGVQPKTDGLEAKNVLKVLQLAEKSMTEKKLQQSKSDYFVHETSLVDDNVQIGSGSKIWHYSHILSHTHLGKNCILGQNVMVGPDVTVGDNCKIQNNVSLYKGVTLGKGVFCGPSCVFTNVNNPRSEIERKDEFRKTEVCDGVTIGANATIVCGVNLGEYCFIGAGAVVTKDVPAFALMVGNPARQIGWVSHSGEKLSSDLICPREGRKYKLSNNKLEEVESELV